MRATAVLVLFAVVAAGPAAAEHVSPGEIRWACGFNGSGQRGHPDDCGIDPIGGQGVQSEGGPEWGAAWTDDEQRVLGFVLHDDARAVPVVMLDNHEIVNARIADRDVAITWCPLCGSGVAFDRSATVAGTDHVLDFAASGFLYNNDLVMWDPQTGTLWNQITGSAIGTLVDGRVDERHDAADLSVLPLVVTTWGEWRNEHPEATMLQKVRANYHDPYGGYETSSGQCGLGTCRDVDGSLHPKEVIIGVAGPPAVAYPIFGVRADGGVIQHDGRIVAVTPGGAHAVHDAGGRSFTAQDGVWVDSNGTAWDLYAGTSTDGDRLEPLVALNMYWFAWQVHHPDTGLWLPQNATSDPGSAPLERDNGKLLGFTVPIVAGVLLLIAVFWRRR